MPSAPTQIPQTIPVHGQQYTFSPVTSQVLRGQLDEKVLEYEGRIKADGSLDATYKAFILRRALGSRAPLNSSTLALEAKSKFGPNFSPPIFKEACGVIAYYLGDRSGAELEGGTKLPESAVHPKTVPIEVK